MEIPISKDLRSYESKDIGIFTFKQAGILAVGVAVSVIMYQQKVSMDVCAIPAVVSGIVAFIKPMGYTVPQFVQTVLFDYMRPKTYINESNYVFDETYLSDAYFDGGEVEPTKLPSGWFNQNQLSNKKNNEEKQYFL